MADQNSVAEEQGESQTLTFRSSDGKEFTVSVSAAVHAVTIRNMVEDDCASGVIPLPEINGVILAKVIEYLNKNVEEGFSDEDKQYFIEEFFEGMHFWFIMEILKAANFLEYQELVDVSCRKMAAMMVNKSVTWVRNAFSIENDFTPEEEAEIKNQSQWAFENVDDDDGDEYFEASFDSLSIQ